MPRLTGWQKAFKKIEKEGDKQIRILYGSAALALCRNWGMKKVAIERTFDVSLDIWQKCAKDKDRSMIAMCEEETGIEVQNGEGKSWHDLPYLNGKDTGPMTEAQLIYMRNQQVKWVAPQIMSCILMSMHQKHGFGYERCARFYGQVEEIKEEYRLDPKRIRIACLEETGIDVAKIAKGG